MGTYIDWLLIKDKEVMKNIFDVVYKYEDIDEIRNQIHTILELDPRKTNNEVHKDVLELAKNKKFDEALEMALAYQKNGYDDAVYGSWQNICKAMSNMKKLVWYLSSYLREIPM